MVKSNRQELLKNGFGIGKFGIGKFGIGKFDVELTKWN